VAASWLIVLEAGGRVTDLAGRPVAIARMVDLLVSNGHLHEQMVAVARGTASDPQSPPGA
jgi:myo-inositol-1(or 4)-monophosphatase